MRSTPGKFAFVVVAVALGVGSLTGVRSFSRSFADMLLSQARVLMAADVSVRTQSIADPAQLAELESLARRGVRWTQITETLSMISAAPPATPATLPSAAQNAAAAANVPLLATIKAVDPAAYPFYGTVELDPPAPLAGVLRASSAVVSPDALLRLGLKPGQTLLVGGQPFTIAAVVKSEPDRLAGSFSVGPRVLLTRAGLDRTGLIQFGSRASERFLFRLGPHSPSVSTVVTELRKSFPDARVMDFRNANPTVQEGLERSTTFLSLISLMALIVGAIGVAMALHAHLQLRFDAIATMKVLGARTSQLVRIYGLQTLLLGIAGGLLGVGLSAAVERTFPRLLSPLFPQLPSVAWASRPAVEGLAAGILITLLFTIPTLLTVRRVAPAAILRRYMRESETTGRGPSGIATSRAGFAGRWARRAARMREALIVGALLFGGVAFVAVALVDAGWRQSLRVGGYFLVAMAVSLLVLAATAWVLLRLLRATAGAASHRLSPALRHGLANIYRPGSQSQAVLIALGVGVMFTLSAYLVQRSMLTELRRSTPPGVSNVFLLDIPPRQTAAVFGMLRAQPGVEHAPEMLPTVMAHLEAVNGVPIAKLALRGWARRFRRPRALTAAATEPDGVTVLQGKWWRSAGGAPEPVSAASSPSASQSEVAVRDEAARDLNLHVGDRLQWSAFGRAFSARVAAIYRPEPHRLISYVEFAIAPRAIAGLPIVVYGAARVQPARIPALETAFYRRYPTITVVNLADVIERVQQVIDQIGMVVHFVSLFAVLAGIVILASAVAGTRFRRMREIALLKTLGATRARVVRIFSTEFFVLGAIAGLMGSLLATAFSNVLAHRLIHAGFRVDFWPNLICIAGAALLAVLAGWLASARLLQQKPLDVLRGE
jgi:putative ABC transport system permease protein